jgi:hypothetical protein
MLERNTTPFIPEDVLGKPRARTRSVTRTVRLDEEVDQMFQQMSDRDRVSANHLINRALRRYAEWEVAAERFGFVTISGSVLGELFDSLTIEQARKLGREGGATSWMEFISFYFKKLDYDSLLKSMELLSHRYGRMFTLETKTEGRNTILIMKHNIGPKRSAYIAEAIRTIFTRFGIKPDITESEDQVTVRVTQA